VTQLDPAQALRNSVDQPAAFAVFYEVFFERILVYLTRRVYDPDVALDLTAESFAQAYLSRGRFRGSVPAEAEAWIYRIAQRKLARYFRRRTEERRAMNRLHAVLKRLPRASTPSVLPSHNRTTRARRKGFSSTASMLHIENMLVKTSLGLKRASRAASGSTGTRRNIGA